MLINQRKLSDSLLESYTNRLIQIYPNIASYSRAEIDNILQMQIYDMLNDYNELKIWYSEALNASLRDNLYLFSAARTFKMMNDLQFLKVADDAEILQVIKSYMNTEFSKMQTEVDLVHKTSKLASEIIESKGQYFRYLSEQDSKVRKWHRKYNNIVLPVTDSFWQTRASKLLSEWNCRCDIVVVNEVTDKQLQASREKVARYNKDRVFQKELSDANKKNGNGVIINIDDNRVITFYENSTIENMPNILRKKYSKKYE